MGKLISIVLMLIGLFFVLLQISIWLNTPMILDNEGIWVTMGKLINCFWAAVLGVLIFIIGFFKMLEE